MNIEFLSPDQAILHLVKSEYVHKQRPAEIMAKTAKRPKQETDNINIIVRYYQKNIMAFTPDDKETLEWYVSALKPYLMKFAIKLLSDINFVKVRLGTDWNYPYTLPNNIIVVNEKFLKEAKLGKETHNDALVRKHLDTLCHELVHIFQKRYPDVAEYIYKKLLGFKKKKVAIHPAIAEQLVTNPDGLDLNWVYGYRLTGRPNITWFLPTMIMMKNGQPSTVLIRLENMVTTFDIIPVNAFPLFKRSFFGFDRHLSHPAEVMAGLVSEYIVYGNRYSFGVSSLIFYRGVFSILKNV